jgi:hypothetical protein
MFINEVLKSHLFFRPLPASVSRAVNPKLLSTYLDVPGKKKNSFESPVLKPYVFVTPSDKNFCALS